MSRIASEWFALYVKARKEQTTSQLLHEAGFDVFVPLHTVRRRWSDRIKELQTPLFPGYVFCFFDCSSRNRVLGFQNVVRIVGSGKQPCPIPAHEIEALRAVVRSESACSPAPFLQRGDRVRVEEGPLRGIEGFVEEIKGSCRLFLSVTLLMRCVAVEIDSRHVRPVPSLAPRAESP